MNEDVNAEDFLAELEGDRSADVAHHPRVKIDEFAAALNNREAAKYLGTAGATLKQSRCTGLLYGVPAPDFKKAGRKIFYLRSTLNSWLGNLPSYSNTAQTKIRK